MRDLILWACAASLLACEPEPVASGSLSLDFYSATLETAGFIPVLDAPESVANSLEVVATRPGIEGFVPITETFSVAAGGGTIRNLPHGEGWQIFVRGFLDVAGAESNTVRVFGATPLFDLQSGDDVRLGVQLGLADCVMLNTHSGAFRRDGGNEELFIRRVGTASGVMPDGRVLITGGADVSAEGRENKLYDVVEIYDPTVGQFFVAPFRLQRARAYHTATLLPNGQVVVFGGLGVGSDNALQVSAEVEVIELSTPSNAVSLAAVVAPEGFERYAHTATLIDLGSDRVSVAFVGGISGGGRPLASVMRFFPGDGGDARTGRFVQQGDMRLARAFHSATRLPRGDAPLAVAGGIGPDDEVHALIEVLTLNASQAGCPNGEFASPDGSRGCFVQPAGAVLGEARFGHRAVALHSGKQVLFVGGFTAADRSRMATKLELMGTPPGQSPENGFYMQGSDAAQNDLPVGAIATGRGDLEATLLADGSVLISGGRQGALPVRATSRLEPCRSTDGGSACVTQFVEAALAPECGLSQERYGHEAIRLQSGAVLFTGGVGLGGPNVLVTMKRSEVYFPRPNAIGDLLR